MQKNEIFDLEIVASGMNGEGVAKIDGFVVFIPNTLIGEVVRVEVGQVKKSFAYAKVIKVLKASEHRKKPLCPVFYKCGGCEMQHIGYPEQLAVKRLNLISCIEKECKIKVEVDEVVVGDNQFGYRNKIQVPIIRDNFDNISVGYYKQNSHDQVPFGILDKEEIARSKDEFCIPSNKIVVEELGDCPLHSNIFQQIIDCFCNYAEDENLSCYDEFDRIGLVRHLVIRRVGNAYAIVVVVNGSTLPNVDFLIKKLNKVVNNYSLSLCKNTKDTNVILTNEIKTLYGKEGIEADIFGVKVCISPLSFMQINDQISEKIYNNVSEIIKKSSNSVVFDVYSGIGILSNIIAKVAKKVYAVEIVKAAVDDANKIAIMNNNQNKIINICGDAAEVLPKLVADIKKNSITKKCDSDECINENVESLDCSNQEKEVVANAEKKLNAKCSCVIENQGKKIADTSAEKVINAECNNENLIVVIDPPRKGCDNVVLESILNVAPNKIIYISCNPATLARDLNALLCDYAIESVTPYDMFPQTSHIETLCCLVRKS